MIADDDVAQHGGPGSDYHVITQRRMPFSLLLSGPAQRHALVHQDIVTDLRGFPDDDTRAVVDEEPPPDGRARVNLDAGEKTAELRDHARQQWHTPAV